MAKKTVFICDGNECGAVLVNPEDGFVLSGVIRTTTITGEATQILTSGSDVTTEISLCRECMAKALGLHL